jgi:hypothetical protein
MVVIHSFLSASSSPSLPNDDPLTNSGDTERQADKEEFLFSLFVLVLLLLFCCWLFPLLSCNSSRRRDWSDIENLFTRCILFYFFLWGEIELYSWIVSNVVPLFLDSCHFLRVFVVVIQLFSAEPPLSLAALLRFLPPPETQVLFASIWVHVSTRWWVCMQPLLLSVLTCPRTYSREEWEGETRTNGIPFFSSMLNVPSLSLLLQ